MAARGRLRDFVSREPNLLDKHLDVGLSLEFDQVGHAADDVAVSRLAKGSLGRSGWHHLFTSLR